MRHTIIMLFFLFLVPVLASCGAGPVNTGLALASPLHLLPDAEAAGIADMNARGFGVCSLGDFTMIVEWDAADGRSRVGEIRHKGQLGAAAYEWGKDSSGWFVERLSSEDGAKRYPGPFERCLSAEALRAPSPRAILWREERAQ